MGYMGFALFLSDSGSGSFVPHLLSRISVNPSVDLCACGNIPVQTRMGAAVNSHNTFLSLQHQLGAVRAIFIVLAANML